LYLLELVFFRGNLAGDRVDQQFLPVRRAKICQSKFEVERKRAPLSPQTKKGALGFVKLVVVQTGNGGAHT
jgi:hypothetical protein